MRVSIPGQCSPGEREEREDRVTSCGQGQQVLALDQRRGSPHLRPHPDHRGERGAGETLDKTERTLIMENFNFILRSQNIFEH